MQNVNNKPCIQKCIVSFSHNRVDSRKLADEMSISKARREIAQGKLGISHLILRAKDDEIDRLKFLFPLHGIPIMCYALGNLLSSSLKEIVVVGSDEVRKVLGEFLEIVGSNGKKVHFAQEDSKNLSMTNTMILGREKLQPDADELILFQPGDLPFMYDIENVIQDEDTRNHNLILWINSRENMFPRYQEEPDSEFVRRNYHYRALEGKNGSLRVHEVKEPNVYPINLAAIETDIIENLHSSRKDGQVLRAGLTKALKQPGRLLKIFPTLVEHIMFFDSKLKKLRPNDKCQFGMQIKHFNKITSLLLNTPFKTKINSDPAFVSDVDALEDWEDFEALTHLANEKHGAEGLSYIHPFGNELINFRENAMPRLKTQIPLYADFPAYMNDLYQSLEMEKVPFDAKGKYISSPEKLDQTEKAYNWYCQKSNKVKK
ncbi:MAG: hypothetical protein ACQ9MH_05035 [Nitrospinales bacterium]